MKITLRDIEIVLALKFDVDITPAAAELILPEVQEFSWQYDREYHRDKKAQDRYFKSCGIEEETYVEVGDRKENAIIMFLYPLIGHPFRLVDETCADNFDYIPSEYFQKHGKALDLKDLPAKKWKTLADLPPPPKRAGKRKNTLPVEPSDNLLKLNQSLIRARCLETTVNKFQMQLGIIADSGIHLARIEIQTSGDQTIFSVQNGYKTLSVDLLPGRCAIRLFGHSGIDKIYAHTEKDVLRAVRWMLD